MNDFRLFGQSTAANNHLDALQPRGVVILTSELPSSKKQETLLQPKFEKILGLIDSSLLFHSISIRWKTLKIPSPSYTTRYHSTPTHLSPRCFCLIFFTSPSLDPRLCWNPVRTFKRFSNAVARRWSFSKAYILPEPDDLSRRGSGINLRLRHPRWWVNGCHIWSWFEDCRCQTSQVNIKLSTWYLLSSKATLITGGSFMQETSHPKKMCIPNQYLSWVQRWIAVYPIPVSKCRKWRIFNSTLAPPCSSQ